jgi:UDP-N-acetyl-D-mannosaminuronate dehydrogenase
VKIAVVGQGYVGLPLAVAAANAGHYVYGFDIISEVIARLSLSEANTPNYTPTTNPKTIMGKGVLLKKEGNPYFLTNPFTLIK